MTEEQKGNEVAKRVWTWLQVQKQVTFVPWVLNPRSDSYDPTKVAIQEERTRIFADLERLMTETANELAST